MSWIVVILSAPALVFFPRGAALSGREVAALILVAASALLLFGFFNPGGNP